jgi:ATP adenylyltransferase
VDHLFTPWRREYVSSLDRPEGCVLCTVREQDDEDARILLRAEHWYVVLNRFPYTTGHLMIVTNEHLGSFADLPAAAHAEYPRLIAQAETALRTVYDPHGLNVGLNLGRAGGAGVRGHLHWHCLPRWSGDTNFIGVVGDTRVLPETLEQTYARLLPRFRPGEA